jgi:hypothetical protein
VQVLNRSFKQAAEAGRVEALTPAASLSAGLPAPVRTARRAALRVGVWALRKAPARALSWLSLLAPFVLYSLIQNRISATRCHPWPPRW